MSLSIKEKIKCSHCGKKRVNYRYGLCQACYKKFRDGKIVHPQGMTLAKSGNCIFAPQSRVRADSNASTLCNHNPHELPFWVEEKPADPNKDPFAWWEAA